MFCSQLTHSKNQHACALHVLDGVLVYSECRNVVSAHAPAYVHVYSRCTMPIILRYLLLKHVTSE